MTKAVNTKKMKTHEEKAWALPPQLPALLLPWYAKNARDLPWRRDAQPYHIWVSEIMLQQTRVETVKDYYLRFLEAVPHLEALAYIKEDKLLKLWEGLGYYSRPRNMQKTARLLVEQYDGAFPAAYEELLQLPGIGPYTAAAMASICFGQPVPAVDGNVLRIITRIAGIDETDSPALKRRIKAALAEIYPQKESAAFTQSLMELGATICLPQGLPKCNLCPLAALCQARAEGDVLRYPRKEPKKPKRVEKLTVLLLFCNGAMAIHRRENQGLLAGLWEFPHVPGELQPEQALELARQWQCQPRAIVHTAKASHVFTHLKWQMRCYAMECQARPPLFTWADEKALLQIYSLPTAFRKFLEECPCRGGFSTERIAGRPS